MKLALKLSSKPASALALLMALGMFASPINGLAQDAHNADCQYKKTTLSPISAQAPVNADEVRPVNGRSTGSSTVRHSSHRTVATAVQKFPTVAVDTVASVTVLTAAPVVPQPSSTVMQDAVNSGSVSSVSTLMAPHLSTGAGEAGQFIEQRTKAAQVETIATITKSDMQDTMKTKMTPDAPDLWRNVLVNHTNKDADGLVRFDYAGLKAAPNDMTSLTSYIDELTAQQPSTFERHEAMVYWANLYNALTVQIVAEHYPVQSIRKIKSGFLPGPWKKNLVTVEGETLSLDNIEHDIMRPTFETPLVHYMVNCASIGCPNLKETPWQVATLDADLETAARAYINSPRGVTSDRGRLQVSSIYKWFEKDFGGSQQSVLEHLAKYADEEVAAKLLGRKKIDKYDYNWGVNAPYRSK